MRNDLLGTATEGETVSSAQIKALNDRVTAGEGKNTPKYVTLTSSGSWTVPAGVYEIDVLLIGGGGGGASGFPSNGGMGGSGGISVFAPKLKVTPGQVIPYVIGAGGDPVKDSETKNGGNTSFNNQLTARGGIGYGHRYYHASYESFWGWFYFILGGKGAPEPLSSGSNRDTALSYSTELNGMASSTQGATSSSAGANSKICEIPKELIGKAYSIVSGAGGGVNATYNGGVASGGGGAGGTVASPLGKDATQPGCGGGGAFMGVSNTGGKGYRGEIYIRYY